VAGEFDPTTQRAVWPSTGNFCRGGAFDSALLGCRAVAILPEEMSPERFEWLRRIGADVIATPGCESNVKEIYDKCWEIRRTDPDAVIFNQFEEFGNYLWHYGVTGPAAESAYVRLAGAAAGRLAAWVATSGSAGTLGAGDYLKQRHRDCRIVAGEALQCPTLLMNGFGGHRIEGIGDKHVPWIHNVRNTDMVVAIDDAKPLAILRLFNEPAGRDALLGGGVPERLIGRLPLLGLSSIANLIASIKVARYHELGRHDLILTPLTDSAELYGSRVTESARVTGGYDERRAVADWERHLLGTTVDHVKELTFVDRKAIHNLKYFTWVEQQGKAVDELNALWSTEFWTDTQAQLPEWDRAIEAFNRETGALERLREL
jgi:cysteine synthase